jgi:hypothetical protein
MGDSGLFAADDDSPGAAAGARIEVFRRSMVCRAG